MTCQSRPGGLSGRKWAFVARSHSSVKLLLLSEWSGHLFPRDLSSKAEAPAEFAPCRRQVSMMVRRQFLWSGAPR